MPEVSDSRTDSSPHLRQDQSCGARLDVGRVAVADISDSPPGGSSSVGGRRPSSPSVVREVSSQKFISPVDGNNEISGRFCPHRTWGGSIEVRVLIVVIGGVDRVDSGRHRRSRARGRCVGDVDDVGGQPGVSVDACRSCTRCRGCPRFPPQMTPMCFSRGTTCVHIRVWTESIHRVLPSCGDITARQ